MKTACLHSMSDPKTSVASVSFSSSTRPQPPSSCGSRVSRMPHGAVGQDPPRKIVNCCLLGLTRLPNKPMNS